MNILVVGASGLVGGNCFQLLRHYNSVTGTHSTFPLPHTVKFDPCRIQDVKLLEKLKPDVIIHTAGFTNVDLCEVGIERSYASNVISTIRLTDYARMNGAKLIYISTDYVFDGLNGPYSESDPVNPINVYGRHKLQAEEYIEKVLEDYIILRVTNVYGNEVRNKNFLARALEALKKGSVEIMAPYDQFATPVNASDIARAIKVMIDCDQKGIYHLAGTDYLSRVQLLQIAARYYPALKIDAVATKELKQQADRPLYGGLLARKFLTEVPGFEFGNVDRYISSIINDTEH